MLPDVNVTCITVLLGALLASVTFLLPASCSNFCHQICLVQAITVLELYFVIPFRFLIHKC